MQQGLQSLCGWVGRACRQLPEVCWALATIGVTLTGGIPASLTTSYKECGHQALNLHSWSVS
eukprot:145120-Amphidinium_carterae.1